MKIDLSDEPALIFLIGPMAGLILAWAVLVVGAVRAGLLIVIICRAAARHLLAITASIGMAVNASISPASASLDGHHRQKTTPFPGDIEDFLPVRVGEGLGLGF